MALLGPALACAQTAPASPQAPWQSATTPPRSSPPFTPDAAKLYTLPELVNLAKQNNPETRVAWENAKVRAVDLGISKATLYPTVAALVTGQTNRDNLFFAPDYFRQTVFTFSPAVELEYTIFDFGRRAQQIAISRNNLLSANFLFNDTHRKVIFDVMAAYYRVLNTKGQQDAAEANLKNAQTVEQAAEARLELGLATLPDVLEARSAAAQADYDLQAALGASEIAHGDLATALGISPLTSLQVESIQSLAIPEDLAVTVESSIDKALAQRPDLMQHVVELRAAHAEVKEAKAAYLPTLSLAGAGGLAKSNSAQEQASGVYSANQEFWSARLNALDEMQSIFARNLEMLAELGEQLLEPDQVKAIRRVRQLRDRLNDGFGAVRAQSDAILFEFGPSRARKLQIRDDVKRWQPQIRTLLLVQITAIQYLTQKPLTDLPEAVAEAGIAFERDTAQVMRAMASEVSRKPVDAVPNIRESAVRVQQEISVYYEGLGTAIPAQAADVVGLTESLATILGPLYEDMRETFAAR